MEEIKRVLRRLSHRPLTRRSGATIVLGIVWALTLANNPSPVMAFALAIVALPLTIPVSWCVVWLIAKVWDHRPPPSAPAFTHRRPSGRRLREDHNATLLTDLGGFLFEPRHWFVGTGCAPTRVIERPSLLRARSGHEPVLLATVDDHRWWMFDGRVFTEGDDLSAVDVRAMVLYGEQKRERRLQHAHAVVSRGAPVTQPREPIADEVKRLVWQRDEGRCRSCGARDQLQFDHVIPVAHGGGNQAENIQLLCSRCNLDKSEFL